jgi:hypothetical protein
LKAFVGKIPEIEKSGSYPDACTEVVFMWYQLIENVVHFVENRIQEGCRVLPGSILGKNNVRIKKKYN